MEMADENTPQSPAPQAPAAPRRSAYAGQPSRRRPAAPRQAEFCSQEEGVPLLRRQIRLHRLQEGGDSRTVPAGARQNPPAPHDWDVRAAPALAYRRDQARPEYRAAALRRRALAASARVVIPSGAARLRWRAA